MFHEVEPIVFPVQDEKKEVMKTFFTDFKWLCCLILQESCKRLEDKI